MRKLSFFGFFILFMAVIVNPIQASQFIDDNEAESSLVEQDAIRDLAKPKIVAAGNINTDGSIAMSFNIKKVEWDNKSLGWYITLRGAAKKFVSNKFIVLVTAIDSYSYTATFVGDNETGQLVVFLHDVNGNRVQQNFCFIVIKI
jgi:hypothetical protein